MHGDGKKINYTLKKTDDDSTQPSNFKVRCLISYKVETQMFSKQIYQNRGFLWPVKISGGVGDRRVLTGVGGEIVREGMTCGQGRGRDEERSTVKTKCRVGTQDSGH